MCIGVSKGLPLVLIPPDPTVKMACPSQFFPSPTFLEVGVPETLELESQPPMLPFIASSFVALSEGWRF